MAWVRRFYQIPSLRSERTHSRLSNEEMGFKSQSTNAPITPDPIVASSDAAGSPETNHFSIRQLISVLDSSFRNSDFETVEKILTSREAEIKRSFAEELTSKEAEKIDLEAQCEILRRRCAEMLGQMEDYESRVKNLEEEYNDVSARERMAQERIARLLEVQKEANGVKEKYIELVAEKREVECGKKRVEDEVFLWKNKCEELEARVFKLEEENSSLKSKEKGDKKFNGFSGGFIDISDDDNDLNGKACSLTECDVKKVADFKNEAKIVSFDCEMKNEDADYHDDGSCGKNFISILTPKRKCGSRVVVSDIEEEEEDDDEDKIPIAILKKRKLGEGKEGNKESNGLSFNCFSRCSDNNGATKHSSNQKVMDEVDDYDDNSCKNFAFSPTAKRKCVSKVVASDSEDYGDDDHMPISELRRRRHEIGDVKQGEKEFDCKNNHEGITPFRRLVRMREYSGTKTGEKGTSPPDSVNQNHSPTYTNNMKYLRRATVRRKLGYSDNEDSKKEDEFDDDGSEIEGDSLGGFIVSGSDCSESNSSSNDTSKEKIYSPSDSSEDESDSDVDLGDVLARIRRKKETKRWEFEADMLTSFAKEPEICMKAVCALYRQQTQGEQLSKQTYIANSRGFNTIDAFKGSMIAEFLLDGEPHGPLKKSAEELEKHYPGGLEYCRKLADRYSKQLFTIYGNKEDPFFHPS